jgi:hypothetical protein
MRLVRLLSHLGRSAGYFPIRGELETHHGQIAGYGNSGAESGYWPDHVPLPVHMGSHNLPWWYPYPWRAIRSSNRPALSLETAKSVALESASMGRRRT